MAPAKKSKSINKRYSSLQEVSPDKDADIPSKQRKKLSDKLGSQWSKVELEHFYEAYRKYGKDWKKVASLLHNRSIEMVEALYNINRAYLSLPEGTASVVGLIAMMTDHYNVLKGSDSERESNGASEIPRSAQSRKRPRVELSSPKEDSCHPTSIASSERYLSLLKMAGLNGTHPRALRKRTPRVPVSNSHKRDAIQNYTPLSKRGQKSEVDANDDVVAALALTEALQRGGSPVIPQMLRTNQIKPSPVRSWDGMFPQSETCKAKHGDAFSEDWKEGSIGGKEHGDVICGRDKSSLLDMEGVGTVEVHRKAKKFYRKKMKVEEMRNNLSDDGGEACSGTEEGPKGSARKGEVDIEVSSTKVEQFLPRSRRKRSKKLFFGDETPALDALNTLANLSTLMLPTSTMESESSAQCKEEGTALETDEKSSAPKAGSMGQHRHKSNSLGLREKSVKVINKVEDASYRKSKLRRSSTTNKKALSKITQQPEPTNSTWKRKRKSSISKVPNADASVDSHSSKSMESKDKTVEENKYISKGKTNFRVPAQSKQWKSVRLSEASPTNGIGKKSGINLALSTAEVPLRLPTKHQNRRKMNLKSVLVSKEVRSSENILKNQPKKQSLLQQEKSPSLVRRLSPCLSSKIARRWCSFEWFYSAIDYPWFAKREFVEYLNHVGLGHIPRLTRVEWGVIRSSLGKPRRFSERFLYEEREKLKQYRESVRKHYAELRTGVRDGLPTDLARPLSVGQRVIAIHPKTREVHDGQVLTVDHDRCRIQFDDPEIGVKFVLDVDCMPLNPLDNMPEALRRQNFAIDKYSLISNEYQINGHSRLLGSIFSASNAHLENATSPFNFRVKQAKLDMKRNIFQAKPAASEMANQESYSQPLTMAHIQGRDADIKAMSELNCALYKKEALLMELRNTNNDIRENHNDLQSAWKDSEHFKKHVAMVLVQLKEANDQASSALLHLRQRNTYPANSLPPWLKRPDGCSFSNGLIRPVDSLVPQELGSGVIEIVKGSRLKAESMVDAAIKAMSSVKEGEDPYVRIGEALDCVDKQQLTSDTRVPVVESPERVNSIQHQQNHSSLISHMSESTLAGASDPKLQEDSDKSEAQIPSELITSCVATLLMIQTCTERQYPPTDVAQIIDSAVTSLHPCCPQNLPVYREIQMCMGRIKTQLLALIPT
ncbi:hypothetical protein SLEP1_g10838 [Rubroshorea leprosula]|uniref:DIRP domain-containing protein n=1 Tax=Rubroshorea leprosula TaxID=152421 RepID=A0AAV5IF97_9ROSI|nr:hypothetical protein SLEP1_g10838 [Rubroshorea leprosula]